MSKYASVDLTLQVVNLKNLTPALNGVVESYGIYVNGKYVAKIRRETNELMWEIWYRKSETPAGKRRELNQAIFAVVRKFLEKLDNGGNSASD